MQNYTKARPWNGKALKGAWHLTIKIDGWRALWNGTEWRSRADKPLMNMPPWVPGMPTDCEVFLGSLRDTSRALRTKHAKPDTPVATLDHLYALDPLDERLNRGTIHDPSAEYIHSQLGAALEQGFEGLVLRQGDRWIKVKPEETHDVLITGFGEGEPGKHEGRLTLSLHPKSRKRLLNQPSRQRAQPHAVHSTRPVNEARRVHQAWARQGHGRLRHQSPRHSSPTETASGAAS